MVHPGERSTQTLCGAWDIDHMVELLRQESQHQTEKKTTVFAGCEICRRYLLDHAVELREWGAFRFGNPTSGGTVFLHVQNLFPRFPLLMNFVSHCVSLASTC